MIWLVALPGSPAATATRLTLSCISFRCVDSYTLKPWGGRYAWNFHPSDRRYTALNYALIL